MYNVKFYKGDYLTRQNKANMDKAVAYVEHHFNSYSSSTASYSIVVTGSNASPTSKNWGRWYAKAVATFSVQAWLLVFVFPAAAPSVWRQTV